MTAIIEVDPEILGGKPVIKGTRIPVDLVLELVELGYSVDQIIEEYPQLSKDVIAEVLKLAKRIHEAVSYDKVKMLVGAKSERKLPPR